MVPRVRFSASSARARVVQCPAEHKDAGARVQHRAALGKYARSLRLEHDVARPCKASFPPSPPRPLPPPAPPLARYSGKLVWFPATQFCTLPSPPGIPKRRSHRSPNSPHGRCAGARARPRARHVRAPLRCLSVAAASRAAGVGRRRASSPREAVRLRALCGGGVARRGARACVCGGSRRVSAGRAAGARADGRRRRTPLQG